MRENDLFFKMVFLGTIISVFLVVLGAAIFISIKDLPELREGNTSIIFCADKCLGNRVVSSNNNSEFGFIRCECLLGIQIDASPFSGAETKIKSSIRYFDSISFKNLSKKDVIHMIKRKVS